MEHEYYSVDLPWSPHKVYGSPFSLTFDRIWELAVMGNERFLLDAYPFWKQKSSAAWETHAEDLVGYCERLVEFEEENGRGSIHKILREDNIIPGRRDWTAVETVKWIAETKLRVPVSPEQRFLWLVDRAISRDSDKDTPTWEVLPEQAVGAMYSSLTWGIRPGYERRPPTALRDYSDLLGQLPYAQWEPFVDAPAEEYEILEDRVRKWLKDRRFTEDHLNRALDHFRMVAETQPNTVAP